MKNKPLAIAFLIGRAASVLMLFAGVGNNSHPQAQLLRQPPIGNTAQSSNKVVDSSILLNCVRLPDREMSFHLSLDMASRTVIDGDQPPTSFSIDGDSLIWRSRVISGWLAKLNRKTLRLVINDSHGDYLGDYLCERISGLN